MSDCTDLVKKGHLKTKSHMLSGWKDKCVALYRASSRGPCRLEQFEAGEENPEIIKLTDVKCVDIEHSSNELVVLTLTFVSGRTKKLATKSEKHALDWYYVLRQHIGSANQMLSSEEGLEGDQHMQKEMFEVTLLKNSKTKFYGKCLLEVTRDSIILYQAPSGKIPLVTWKINTVRRYGRDNGNFKLEAGRSASTGEGTFVMSTAKAEQIYQKVSSAAHGLVKSSSKQMQDGGLIGHVFTVSRPDIKDVNPKPEPRDNFNNIDIPVSNLKDQRVSNIRAHQPLPRPPKTGSASGYQVSNVVYSKPDRFRSPSIPEDDLGDDDTGSQTNTASVYHKSDVSHVPAITDGESCDKHSSSGHPHLVRSPQPLPRPPKTGSGSGYQVSNVVYSEPDRFRSPSIAEDDLGNDEDDKYSDSLCGSVAAYELAKSFGHDGRVGND